MKVLMKLIAYFDKHPFFTLLYFDIPSYQILDESLQYLPLLFPLLQCKAHYIYTAGYIAFSL